ncbi:hypothetical protein Tco_0832865 [Tanacetum coccineum]
MYSPAHPDIETTLPVGGARGSPVPTPFHDNPYMLLRQTYTSTIMDTESEPFEDPIYTKDHQSLPISSAPIPSPDYTPATSHTDEDSKPMEAFKTRVALPHSTTSPSDPTSPLSPDHILPT